MSEGTRRPHPVRIELATSEIEGGACRTWADPAQVLAVLAQGEPADAFVRWVEPKLHDLAAETCELTGEDPTTPGANAPALPALVRVLAGRLQAVHARLYRENRSLMKEPCWVQVACALAEEDRIYFVRSAPCWVGLLRDGKAYSAGPSPTEGGKVFTPLGRAETLNLEVTSLAVLPGDTVVLLTAETDTPPDLHAVRNLFTQTQDLKRACDGLVNLQGLISASAGAVAMRFLPVESSPYEERENPLAGLTSDLRWGGGERLSAIGADPVDATAHDVTDTPVPAPVPLPVTPPIEPLRVSGASQVLEPLTDLEPNHDSEESFWSGESEAEGSSGPEALPPPSKFEEEIREVIREEIRQETREVTQEEIREEMQEEFAETVVGTPESDSMDVGPRPWSSPSEKGKGLRVLWPALAGLAGVMLLLLVALPKRSDDGIMGRLLSGRGGSHFGTVEVSSEPPAAGVLVDGVLAAEGTPAVLDSLEPGLHRIGLDLGPCGVWETEVEVPAGGSVQVVPHLNGSVEVSSEDPSTAGLVWTEGRDKVAVPARLDSLPIGWNRLFFEDARIPLWDRLVLVKAGQVSHVSVPNTYSADQGVVRVEGMKYAEQRGMMDSAGDSIWIDGAFAGATPLETELVPGLHSVRVGAGDGCYTEIFEVRARSARHVLAQLGQGPRPTMKHVAPGRIAVHGSVLLSVEIQGAEAGPGLHPTLHLPELAPGSREIPLSAVDVEAGIYVGAIDPGALPAGRPVAYYFTVNGPNGETVWSDLYRLQTDKPWNQTSGDPTPSSDSGTAS